MKILISVFENSRAAHSAFDRLLEAGFQRDDVHLQEDLAQGNIAVSAAASTHAHTERGVLSSIGRFFASLFGQDPPIGYVDRYSDAIWHGHPVIVVEAKDEDEANRASAMLRECGAYDIDELPRWRGAAATAGASAKGHRDVMAAGQRIHPPHIFPGSVRAAERDRAMAAAEQRAQEAREK